MLYVDSAESGQHVIDAVLFDPLHLRDASTTVAAGGVGMVRIKVLS
jgi:hypothetical protein